jgi:Carboxyl transferase domain
MPNIHTCIDTVHHLPELYAYTQRLLNDVYPYANADCYTAIGYQALNTLMGREVYASNDQLGGAISVMIPNGVSHLTADTHMEAVKSALKWLSYVPAVKSSYLPVVDITGIIYISMHGHMHSKHV